MGYKRIGKGVESLSQRFLAEAHVNEMWQLENEKQELLERLKVINKRLEKLKQVQL